MFQEGENLYLILTLRFLLETLLPNQLIPLLSFFFPISYVPYRNHLHVSLGKNFYMSVSRLHFLIGQDFHDLEMFMPWITSPVYNIYLFRPAVIIANFRFLFQISFFLGMSSTNDHILCFYHLILTPSSKGSKYMLEGWQVSSTSSSSGTCLLSVEDIYHIGQFPINTLF